MSSTSNSVSSSPALNWNAAEELHLGYGDLKVLIQIHPDDIDLVNGIPVGVQVVSGKYEEEKCIAIAKVIERLLKENEAQREFKL